MTITKGAPWGEPRPLPADAPVARDDAEAAAIVAASRHRYQCPPPLGLVGGDLCRTLGGRGDRQRLYGTAATSVPLDLMLVRLDGGAPLVAVAHVTAWRSWWIGPVVAAMNAAWLGTWNLGPRAHPNDGLVDLMWADLPVAQRRQARRRARTGSHVPHPSIRTERRAQVSIELRRPTPVRVDGRRRGAATHIDIEVEADAFRAVV